MQLRRQKTRQPLKHRSRIPHNVYLNIHTFAVAREEVGEVLFRIGGAFGRGDDWVVLAPANGVVDALQSFELRGCFHSPPHLKMAEFDW